MLQHVHIAFKANSAKLNHNSNLIVQDSRVLSCVATRTFPHCWTYVQLAWSRTLQVQSVTAKFNVSLWRVLYSLDRATDCTHSTRPYTDTVGTLNIAVEKIDTKRPLNLLKHTVSNAPSKSKSESWWLKSESESSGFESKSESESFASESESLQKDSSPSP